MESSSKTSRKVRFTLPESQNHFVSFIRSRNSSAVQVKQKPILPPIPIDETKIHGTSRYVNGTLNFGQEDFKAVVEDKKPNVENKDNKKVVEPKLLRPCIKSPRKAREVKRVVANEEANSRSLPLTSSLSKKFHYFIRSKNDNHEKKKDITGRNRANRANPSHAAFYFPDNEARSCITTPSRPSRPSRPPRRKQILEKTPDILTVPCDIITSNLKNLKLIENSSMLCCHLKGKIIDESNTIPKISTETKHLPHMERILVDDDINLQNFSQFFNRWCFLHNVANRKLSNRQINRNIQNQSSVYKSNRKLSDGKSSSLLSANYRKRIMNIQKTPLVTSLLRASKDANIEELQPVIRSILDNGITKNDLNSVDKNGRTALSYICSTSLTNVLDVLLRLPGIDVNKPDNDGNAPLHYAAETGQSDVITMLTTRSRSLKIDLKNNFGLTPLMKAAIQGRTDCAKRLMLATASPSEIDTGREMTAAEWARLCGRHFCADSIAQIARIRNLTKTVSSMSNDDASINKKIAIRSSSAIISANKFSSSTATGGLATKLRSVFPFYKKKLVSESDLPDLVTHMKLEKDLQPAENIVPKVEVTPANNQSLIEKYKNRNYSDSVMDAPKVPLRKKIV